MRVRACAQRGDHGERGVERGEARNARLDRRATDEEAVAVDVRAQRGRVQDHGAAARADEIEDRAATDFLARKGVVEWL